MPNTELYIIRRKSPVQYKEKIQVLRNTRMTLT
jgi:hypothetical protein